jgi:uncharacterized repeat protein (TIGR02543 family)
MSKGFSKFSRLIPVVILVLLSIIGLAACSKQEAEKYYANFYVDDAVYASVELNDSFAMPADPIKNGYVFQGWFTDKDTLTAAFSSDGVAGATANINVYAKWRAIDTANELTIKFIVDGNVYALRTVKNAAEFVLPSPPTKDGSLFLGWYTDAAGTTTFLIANVTSFSGETLVYAKWGDPTDLKDVIIAAVAASDAQYTAYKIVDVNSTATWTYTVIANRTGSILDSLYIADEGTNGNSQKIWLLNGIIYNAEVYSGTVGYERFGAPKDAAGNVDMSGYDQLEYFLYHFYESVAADTLNDVTSVGGGKYTLSIASIPYEFTIENGRLTKIASGTSTAIDFKYDGGKYDLPAIPDVTWQQLYTVTLIASDGQVENETGIREFSASKADIDVELGYEIGGIYRNANFTDEFTSEVLTADITLYVKIIPVTGDTGTVRRALAASLNMDAYILKYTTDYEFRITVAELPDMSRPSRLTVKAYYYISDYSEKWSDGTSTWVKSGNDYLEYGYSSGDNFYDSHWVYEIGLIEGFALKTGTTNVYVGSSSNLGGTVEVTLTNGLVTKVSYSDISFDIGYNITAETGIPAKPNVTWTHLYNVRLLRVVEGSTYNNSNSYYLTGLTEAEAIYYTPTGGYFYPENGSSYQVSYSKVEFFLDEALTQPVVFPLVFTADIDIHVKCTVAAEGEKFVNSISWSAGYIDLTVGDKLEDLTTQLHVDYSDNTSEEISLPDAKVKVTGFDTSKAGKITLYFVYQSRAVRYALTVYGTHTNEAGDVFQYTLSGENAIITGYNSNSSTGLTNIIIPSVVNGHPVTGIAANAFGSTYGANVTIPASVTDIAEYLFSPIVSITVDGFNTVYKSIDGVLFNKDGTKLISYPGQKTGDTYTVPNGVVEIPRSAFTGNGSLKSIVLPASLTEFGTGAFSNLVEITVNPSNTVYKSIDGVLFSKDGSTLITYPRQREVAAYTVPNGVTEIGSEAFNNCYYLTSIILPAGLTTINENGIFDCNYLEIVFVPASVTTIANFAFRYLGNATLYFEAASQSDGWSDGWSDWNISVVWGTKLYSTAVSVDSATFEQSIKDVFTTYGKTVSDITDVSASINYLYEDYPADVMLLYYLNNDISVEDYPYMALSYQGVTVIVNIVD